MVPVGSSVILMLVLAVHSYHVIAYLGQPDLIASLDVTVPVRPLLDVLCSVDPDQMPQEYELCVLT